MATRLWQPSDATSATLVAWFDAQAASTITYDTNNKVLAWASRVGGFSVAASGAAQPTYRPTGYNGLPTVDFSASGTVMTAAAPSTFPTGSTPSTMSLVAVQAVAGSQYATLFSYGTRATAQLRSISSHSNKVSVGTYGNDEDGTVAWLGYDRVGDWLIDASGNSVIWVDGSAGGTAALKALATPATSTMYVGGGADGSDWGNPIQELLLYSGQLSASELQQLQGYRAWRWGVQGQLPASHPFKNAAPTITNTSGANATAAIALGGMTTLALARLAARGSSARLLGPLIATGSARILGRGEAAITLPPVMLTSGARSRDSAQALLVLSPLLIAAASSSRHDARAQLTLAPLALMGTSQLTVQAGIGASLGTLSTAAAGNLPSATRYVGQLGALTAGGSAALFVRGGASVILDGVSISAATHGADRAAAAISLRPLLVSAASSSRHAALAIVSLAPVIAAVAAVGPGRGRSTVCLAPLSPAAAGQVTIRSTVSSRLAPLRFVAAGIRDLAGRALILLDPVGISAHGAQPRATVVPASRIARIPAPPRAARIIAATRIAHIMEGHMATWPTRYITDDLDYKADWSNQPGFAGETIAEVLSVTVTGSACTVDDGQTANDASSVTIRLCGGEREAAATVEIVVQCASGNRFTGAVEIRSY